MPKKQVTVTKQKKTVKTTAAKSVAKKTVTIQAGMTQGRSLRF